MAAGRADRSKRDDVTPATLAFVSAYVDAICYIALYRTFAAFITGTGIVLAVEIFDRGDATMKTVVLAAFVATTIAWVLLIRRFLASHPMLLPILFGLEAAFILAFAVAGAGTAPFTGSDDPDAILVIVIAVVAMSLQNALMTTLLSHHVPTTVMTGNLGRFLVASLDLVSQPRGTTDDRPDVGPFRTRSDVARYALVIAGFAAGALAGAGCYYLAGFWAGVVPAVAIAVLAIREVGIARRAK